jgi:hypothetical protein
MKIQNLADQCFLSSAGLSLGLAASKRWQSASLRMRGVPLPVFAMLPVPRPPISTPSVTKRQENTPQRQKLTHSQLSAKKCNPIRHMRYRKTSLRIGAEFLRVYPPCFFIEMTAPSTPVPSPFVSFLSFCSTFLLRPSASRRLRVFHAITSSCTQWEIDHPTTASQHRPKPHSRQALKSPLAIPHPAISSHKLSFLCARTVVCEKSAACAPCLTAERCSTRVVTLL